MNKRGFTLIELLAVIVILAIIALIATPIILGIINDARESAKKRSAELVYTGVEYAYTTSMYQKSNAGEEVTIENINSNFNVENTSDKSAVSGASGSKSFTVKTAEGVTCTVAEDTQGFKVTCGNYLNGSNGKTVVTKTSTN